MTGGSLPVLLTQSAPFLLPNHISNPSRPKRGAGKPSDSENQFGRPAGQSEARPDGGTGGANAGGAEATGRGAERQGQGFLHQPCDGLDRQIDALVYDLYALTPAEIQIVANPPPLKLRRDKGVPFINIV